MIPILTCAYFSDGLVEPPTSEDFIRFWGDFFPVFLHFSELEMSNVNRFTEWAPQKKTGKRRYLYLLLKNQREPKKKYCVQDGPLGSLYMDF